jgi:hypothetical protein
MEPSPPLSHDRRSARRARSVLKDVRLEVRARLPARHPEIEQAVLTRVFAVPEPTEVLDPEYLEGLCSAVPVALDYGIAAIEHGAERSPPIPAALLIQARLAAQHGVRLDTVMRRYLVGHTLLVDFLIEAADGLSGSDMFQLLRTQAAAFERLIAVVIEEYTRESENPTSA